MNVQALFSSVLNMSLTGSVVIVFVLFARLLLRRAPKVFSYALWAVVLFRLLCPVSFSSAFSVLHFTQASTGPSEGYVSSVQYTPMLDIYQYSYEPNYQEPNYQSKPLDTPSDTSIPENRTDLMPTPDAVSQQASAEPVREPIYYAAYIWLVGMALMFAINVRTYRNLRKKLVGAVRLRRNVFLADHIPSAFVMGVIRPRIYLPSTLAPSERRYIIAHERCHIRRKDHIIKLLAYGALCMHWFNPLVWIGFTLSGKDMEMSCDEAVIGRLGPKIRADYSASLLRLSTAHRIIAATPLAFGEGDTKGRVLNMAKWKKPKFWVVITAAMLCVSVLVACAMNPANPTQPEANPETTPTTDTFAIPDGSPEDACKKAIDTLKTQASYYILYTYDSESYEEEGSMEYRRHGEDLLIENQASWLIGSTIFFEGQYGMFYGDYWAMEGEKPDYDPNDWLSRWSLEDKQVSDLHWTEDATVVFEAVWPHQLHKDMEYKGTFTYSFKADGSLASIKREYVMHQNGEIMDATIDQITVMQESAGDTYAAIRKVAEQCLTLDQLEAFRQNQDTVTEVPSNSTRYDKEYELGSAQMRWKFLDGTWQTAHGAENATPTSVTLFYSDANDHHTSFVADEGFWLETLVNGKWIYVNESLKKADSQRVEINVSGGNSHRYQLDWSDSYGKLSPGFYRIGRNHTVTLDNGQSQTNVCYAKFRILDGNIGELLDVCQKAFNGLLEGERYHIYVTSWLTQHDYSYYITNEVWKSGSDYLEDIKYPLRSDPNTLYTRRGGMLRHGNRYDLEWSGDTVTSPIASWQSNTYMDEGTFQIWTSRLEWYDARVESVVQKNNRISIIETYDFDDKYEATEITLTFDGDGNLTAMTAAYLPTRNCAQEEKIIDVEMVVRPTSSHEIASIIAGQDLSQPMGFSYTQDVADNPDAQTGGFVNTSPKTISTMEDALGRAKQECTLEPQESLSDACYNMTAIYYDPDTQMWKVVFLYSANSDIYQAVYMDHRGVTQMIVHTAPKP